VFVRRGRKMGVVHTPVVQTLRRLRQEVGEFKASLGYSVRPCPLSLRQGERERERKRERERRRRRGEGRRKKRRRKKDLSAAMRCHVQSWDFTDGPHQVPCHARPMLLQFPSHELKKPLFFIYYPVCGIQL
jgi:hypothetical protein